MSAPTNKPQMPYWARVAIIGCAIASVPYTAKRVAKDSPVHFGVVGEAPKDAIGWDCKPEGGLYGAPLVCRYRQMDALDSTDMSVSTETK